MIGLLSLLWWEHSCSSLGALQKLFSLPGEDLPECLCHSGLRFKFTSPERTPLIHATLYNPRLCFIFDSTSCNKKLTCNCIYVFVCFCFLPLLLLPLLPPTITRPQAPWVFLVHTKSQGSYSVCHVAGSQQIFTEELNNDDRKNII